MSTLNQEIKDRAKEGVFEVIEWARIVQRNTMDVTTLRTEEGKDLTPFEIEQLTRRFTLSEREEARKILLEYGAGKPTRIVEHIGNKKKPICFETEVVRTKPQLPEYVSAEVVTDEAANT